MFSKRNLMISIIALSIFLLLAVLLIFGVLFNIIQFSMSTKSDYPIADDVPPTLILSANSNDSGEYYINLIRDIDTVNFDPLSLIAEVSDNINSKEDIIVSCDTKLDTSRTTQYLSYTATDKAGNATTVKLLVIYSDDRDKIRESQKEQISKLEEDIAKIESDVASTTAVSETTTIVPDITTSVPESISTTTESTTTVSTTTSSTTSKVMESTTVVTTAAITTKAPEKVYHEVNDFTIHSSGDLQADLQTGALENCSYGGCGGLLGAYQFEMKDDIIIIHWTCTCGWTGISHATLK